MVQNGNNCKGNNKSIGGDRGMEGLWADFQTYGENINREFQEIRNILTDISLRLEENGANSCIFKDRNLPANYTHKTPTWQQLRYFLGQRRYHPKLELQTFHGFLDVEYFFGWSSKVENWLGMMEVPENQEAKYIACRLRGRALALWEVVQKRRRYQGKHSVKTWRKMKKLMVEQFLPLGDQQYFFQNYQQRKQSFSFGAGYNFYETPEQTINIQESPIWTIAEGCLIEVQEENRYGYCEEEVEIAKEEEESANCVDEVETSEEDKGKHFSCVFTDLNVYQEHPSNHINFIPWLGMNCGNLESKNLAKSDVVIQEEIKMKTNSTNSKNKVPAYQRKQAFRISRELLIFFRKEFVPVGTFHRLMSPKRYVYFKVRKKKSETRGRVFLKLRRIMENTDKHAELVW